VVVCFVAAGIFIACQNRCAENTNDTNPTTATELTESRFLVALAAKTVLFYRVGQLKLFNLLLM
jgi:hypothetical protein